MHGIQITSLPIVGHCIFSQPWSQCRLDKSIPCRFGITEIVVPRKCPLRKQDVVVKLVVMSK